MLTCPSPPSGTDSAPRARDSLVLTVELSTLNRTPVGENHVPERARARAASDWLGRTTRMMAQLATSTEVPLEEGEHV